MHLSRSQIKEINQYYPSATFALVCFVNCTTGLCHFYIKSLTHVRHSSMRHLQCTFLTDVPGRGDSCIPELSRPAKHTVLQVWCRQTTRLPRRRGQWVQHQGSKGESPEEWIGNTGITFSGTNSGNFLEETKLLAVVPRNVTPNVLVDKLMLKSAAKQIVIPR